MDEKPQPELRWDGEKAGYFDTEGVERWTVLPAEIVLIAEFATEGDPVMVIWTLEQGVLMSVRCPLDRAAGKVLVEMANLLSFDPDMRVIESSDRESLVLWPQELAGEEYFTFEPVKAKHWWGVLVHRLMETKEKRISDRVTEFLNERKAKA